MAKRHALLGADNYKVAKEIVAWKQNIVAHWDEIEVVNSTFDAGDAPVNVGGKCKVAVELDTKGLNDNGLGVELVAIRTSTHNNDKLYEVQQLELVKTEGSHLFLRLTIVLTTQAV